MISFTYHFIKDCENDYCLISKNFSPGDLIYAPVEKVVRRLLKLEFQNISRPMAASAFYKMKVKKLR